MSERQACEKPLRPPVEYPRCRFCKRPIIGTVAHHHGKADRPLHKRCLEYVRLMPNPEGF